jgi:broad specificity phosphatase PhoE
LSAPGPSGKNFGVRTPKIDRLARILPLDPSPIFVPLWFTNACWCGLTAGRRFPHQEACMQGHELLETIHQLPASANAAAVMRHAARHPIANPAEPTLAEITPEGAKAAEEFGAHITGFARVRLFHSPVKRCRQTAGCIAQGVAKAGLAAEVAGPREEIGVAYIRDLVEAGRWTVKHGDHFVRLWITGQVPETVIGPARELAGRERDFVAARLREPADGGRRLDLHISHDWNIIILRELLLGVRHEDAGWLAFLDGVAFTLESGVLRAVYRERSREAGPVSGRP